MGNIKVLDCTLRDGGRIIDCAFPDEEILAISQKLATAKIDIIEVGFLRDWRKTQYNGNSTFFTDVDQIKPFVKNRNAEYVAFVDYGMFDFDTLKKCDGESITGIRVGFTKKNKKEHYDDILRCLHIVKEQGYKLFIQGVNTLNYSDKEILELVEMVNAVKPYSFGIVDTYGAMYLDDVTRIFALINNNMDPEICVDFHSHNNYQLSNALAQQVILMAQGNRKVIIDGTLDGIGKVAGNLNTELIVDYLVRKHNCNYDFDQLLDLIDNYIIKYRDAENWGYSIPALLSGNYQAHPNNVRYLTSKFRLLSKDIKNILSMIEPELRQRYDYDNIDKLYLEYNSKFVDDEKDINELRKIIADREVLIIVPGESIEQQRQLINEYIQKNSPFVVSVNHVSEYTKWSFWGNSKQYEMNSFTEDVKRIVTSNLKDSNAEYVINYYSVINEGYKYYENTTFMLLNLLKILGCKQITFAGFDGFDNNKATNYLSNKFQNERHKEEFVELNKEITSMLADYWKIVKGTCQISFLTNSMFEKVIKNEES